MGNRKSLAKTLVKYSLLELFYSFIIILVSFFILRLLMINGNIYPANYAENQLPKIVEETKKSDWKISDLPFYYQYKVISSKEENIHKTQTIDEKYKELISKAINNGKSKTDTLIYPRVFVHIKNNNIDMVVSYKVAAIPNSKELYSIFPNFELIYMGTFFILWVLGFSLLIYRSISIIRKELNKINQTNLYIRNLDLDYPVLNSDYKETDYILSSLNSMSLELKKTLNELWTRQEKEKSMIESLSHDIRTPITLIKGNLELLEEDSMQFNSNTINEKITNIQIGIQRLEKYIEKLKSINFNLHSEEDDVHDSNEKMTLSDKNVIENLISSLNSTAKFNNYNLIVLKKDNSQLLILKEDLYRALENLLINSIENSSNNKDIYLSFENKKNTYSIYIEDRGPGFSQVDLKNAKSKYYTSKKYVGQTHGLGLHIVDQIAKKYNGKLILENIYNENTIIGARARLEFNT